MLQEGKAIAADDKPIPLAGDETIESIQRAENAGQMWAAIGQDSYSIVPIQSTLNPEAQLEGTRLTVVSLLILPLLSLSCLAGQELISANPAACLKARKICPQIEAALRIGLVNQLFLFYWEATDYKG